MNFSCDKCQRRYSIADEKVRGKTLKLRCKNCQSFISVVGPPEEVAEVADFEEVQPARAEKNPWAHETTRPVGLDPKLEWFAMVRGEQVGPLNGQALMAKVVAGEIDHRTYVWREGLGDWKRAGEIPELAAEMVQHQEEPRTPIAGPVVPPVRPGAPAPAQSSWSVHVEQSFEDEAAAKGMPLGRSDPLNSDIFKGLDLKGTRPAPLGEMDLPTAPQMDKQRAGKPNDPFAALGDLDPSKIAPSGENTSYYIAKSGVKDRNPPWKIAAFIAAAILVPTGLLYALSALKVVPLEVTHVNEQGQEVKDSVFSAGGVSGLRDILLGKKRQPLRPPEIVVKAPVPKAQADGDERPGEEGQPVAAREKGGADGGSKSVDGIMDNLAALYADPAKRDVGPKIRKGDLVPHSTTPGEGPPDADVAKVVGQMQPAFQFCIEQEMKKNPSFKGGKINIVATVGASGTVKQASIDRRDIDSSGLGDCLKAKARRMVFTAFEGDDVELQIPLILTTTM